MTGRQIRTGWLGTHQKQVSENKGEVGAMLESSGSRWFLLEERFEGWRDDPVVKNSGYSLEDPESILSTML